MRVRLCSVVVAMLGLIWTGITLAAKATPGASSIQLASLSAAVIELKSASSIYEKHPNIVVPIASITKLMSAMVLLDRKQSLTEKLIISRDGFKSAKNAYSRMRVGSKLSRKDLLQLSLMSSENLATFVLAANYPGGAVAFVTAMNQKAKSLGMQDTRFADPTGLNPGNQSTAADLVKMILAATNYPLIQKFSTSAEFTANFTNPRYTLSYRNTNLLVRKGEWDISLSKTGYLSEAGRCLVMLTNIGGKQVAMVLLDSFGKYTPVGDAGRIKKWLTTGNSGAISSSAVQYEKKKRQKYDLDEKVSMQFVR